MSFFIFHVETHEQRPCKVKNKHVSDGKIEFYESHTRVLLHKLVLTFGKTYFIFLL